MFENWRTYFNVKAAFEKKVADAEREKVQLETRMKALPKGTMAWHYDN